DPETVEALKPLRARETPARMQHFVEARREPLLWWASQAKGLASWDIRDFGLKRMPCAVAAFYIAATPSDPIEGLALSARLRQAAFELAVERSLVSGRALGEGCCILLPVE